MDTHCKLVGIQLSREVHEANGSVDILFSCTNAEGKILKGCVEIKKAHHADIETAVKTQLPLYMQSAETDAAIYLIVWLKNSKFAEPIKYKTEEELLLSINKNIDSDNISVKILNCNKRSSPSKNKLPVT